MKYFFSKLPVVVVFTAVFFLGSQSVGAQEVVDVQTQWSASCPSGWTDTGLLDDSDSLHHLGEEDTVKTTRLCVRSAEPSITLNSVWADYSCPSGYVSTGVTDDAGSSSAPDDTPSNHSLGEKDYRPDSDRDHYVWCFSATGSGSPQLNIIWQSSSATEPACQATYARFVSQKNGNPYNLNTQEVSSGGISLCVGLTWTPVATPAPTATLNASPSSIANGASATLTWSSTDATSCTGTNFSTGNATSGSVSTGSLSSSQTYSVTCTGPGGSANDSATVNVAAAGQPDLTASSTSPTSAVPNESVTFSTLISNNGNASTNGDFTVLFQRANSSSGSGATDINIAGTLSLNASSNRSVSTQYTFSSTGTYYVRACADQTYGGNGSISESNEVNNCGPWTQVTVSFAPTDGDCGAANGVPAVTPHPGTGLCDQGNASAVNSSGSNHTWTCSGLNGGNPASCSAPKSATACSVDLQGNGSNGPLAVNQGSNVALNWTTSNAVSCSSTGTGWTGSRTASGGSSNVTINQSSLYSISCSNSAGNTCSDSVSVSMNASQPAPAVDIRANGSNGPVTAGAGSLVNIGWNSSDATSCTASASPSSSGWQGSKSTTGSQSWTMPSSNTVLTIQCTGPGGVASDSVTVNANTAAGECGPAAGVPTLSPPSGPSKCSPVGSPQSSVQLLGSPGNQYYQWTCYGSPNTTCTAPYGSPPPSADLKVNNSDGPVTVPSGSNLSLSWSVMDTAECYLYGAGISPYPRLVGNTSGSYTIYGATASSDYAIGCHAADYSTWIEDSVSVIVSGFAPPAITLQINGSSSNPVTVGQSGATTMNIAWSTTNATSCTVTQGTGWSGSKIVPSGSEDIPVAVSSYTLQCTGPGGVSSVTRNTQLPSTLKICETSCDNGGFNPSSYTMQIGSTKNLVACWNSSSTCDNSSGNVTNSASWTQGGGNAISVSGTNPRVLSADNQGSETIRASYSGNNVTKTVQVVACLPSVDASNCNNDTCGEIQVDNGCGTMITCPVQRACDYNWKEVAP